MSRMIPQYSTNIFTDIYDDVDEFVYDFKHVGIPYQYTVGTTTYQTISDTNIQALYYLLYARYGVLFRRGELHLSHFLYIL